MAMIIGRSAQEVSHPAMITEGLMSGLPPNLCLFKVGHGPTRALETTRLQSCRRRMRWQMSLQQVSRRKSSRMLMRGQAVQL